MNDGTRADDEDAGREPRPAANDEQLVAGGGADEDDDTLEIDGAWAGIGVLACLLSAVVTVAALVWLISALAGS